MIVLERDLHYLHNLIPAWDRVTVEARDALLTYYPNPLVLNSLLATRSNRTHSLTELKHSSHHIPPFRFTSPMGVVPFIVKSYS